MSSDLAPGLWANLALSAALLLGCMMALWLLSIALRNMSIVDVFWGPGFAIVALLTCLSAGAGAASGRNLLISALTVIWGLRLGAYIYWRNRGKPEDARYAELYRKAGVGNVHARSLVQVFLLQGALIWVISAPVQLAQFYLRPAALGIPAWAGAALWLVGFAFEAVGDWQLARFKARASNRGKLMSSGLWAYTRHPNYFGNACLWWGLFLIACDNALGAFTIFSPLLMTYLLVNVSGKKLLEQRMRETRPEYAAYVERTSGFFPLPPRAGSPSRSRA